MRRTNPPCIQSLRKSSDQRQSDDKSARTGAIHTHIRSAPNGKRSDAYAITSQTDKQRQSAESAYGTVTDLSVGLHQTASIQQSIANKQVQATTTEYNRQTTRQSTTKSNSRHLTTSTSVQVVGMGRTLDLTTI